MPLVLPLLCMVPSCYSSFLTATTETRLLQAQWQLLRSKTRPAAGSPWPSNTPSADTCWGSPSFNSFGPQLGQWRCACILCLSRGKSELPSISLPVRSTLLIKICRDRAGVKFCNRRKQRTVQMRRKSQSVLKPLLRAQLLILSFSFLRMESTKQLNRKKSQNVTEQLHHG